MDITQIPDDQLQAMLKQQQPDITQLSDAQLNALAQQRGANVPLGTDYDKLHADMVNNAMQQTATNPLAAVTGYAANMEKMIPFMHETGSAFAAAFGAGQGKNFGERYNNLEQAQQTMREGEQQTQPRIETPSWLPDITPNLLGEAGATLATAPLMPGNKVANTLGQAIKQGATTGAKIGSVYGLSDTNSFQDWQDAALDRLGHGIVGTTLGAGFGGPLGGLGYKTAQSATNLVDKNTPEEIKMLSEKFGQDNVSPQKLAASLRLQKEQPVTIADVAGTNTQSLAEAIANQPGEGMNEISDFLNNRNIGQPSRINDIIEQHVAPLNYFEQRQASLKALGDDAISQAYQDAYAAAPKINDPQINQAIDRLVSTPVGSRAWSQATQAATLEGKSLGNVDALGNMRSLSTYGLDTYQKELNSVIKSERINGNFDRMSPLGTKVLGLNKQISLRLEELNPQLQQARNLYSNDASLLNAMDAGFSDLWGSKWQNVLQDYNDMSQPEQDAFKSGMARKISELTNTQAGDKALAGAQNPGRTILNNDKVRERISAIMGDKAASNFESAISNQAAMQDLGNKVLANSATARRLAAQKDLNDQSQSFIASKVTPVAKYLANLTIDRPGSWFGVTPSSVEQFGNKLSADKNRQLAQALAQKLFSPDYHTNMQTLYQTSLYPNQVAASQKALAEVLKNGLITQGGGRAAIATYQGVQ
jgi:hypothetical protein